MILPGALVASSLLAELVDPALRAIVLAAIAGITLSVFRVRDTSLRLRTWKAVLYSALAMPLLVGMLPRLSIPLPRLFQNEALAEIQMVHKEADLEPMAQILPVTSSARIGDELKPASQPAVHKPTLSQFVASLNWSAVTVAIYLAVTLVFIARILVGMMLSQRLIHSSRAVHDDRLASRLSAQARTCGIAVAPQAAASECTSVPLTTGILRSRILLPLCWRDWDDATLDAVVAHEVSHIARRDALTQFVSLVHRAVFWFSPFAWWLNRHLADLAEQASDEAALSAGADRNEYARTLLGFFEKVQGTPSRVWWQGVSMATAGRAEQRLEKVLTWKGTAPMNVKKSIAITILALAIPLVCLAAAIRPTAGTDGSHRVNVQHSPLPPTASVPAQEATPSVPPPPSANEVSSSDAPEPPSPADAAAPQEPAPPITTGPIKALPTGMDTARTMGL